MSSAESGYQIHLVHLFPVPTHTLHLTDMPYGRIYNQYKHSVDHSSWAFVVPDQTRQQLSP